MRNLKQAANGAHEIAVADCVLTCKTNHEVTVTGKITINNVKELWQQSLLLLSNLNSPITINLQAVTQCDSSGIALLIAWVRYGRQYQKTLAFVGASAQIRSIIQVSGLQEVLPLK